MNSTTVAAISEAVEDMITVSTRDGQVLEPRTAVSLLQVSASVPG